MDHLTECDYINGGDNRVWMQILNADNKVTWKIFPRNIPEEYIGEKVQKQEELTATLICETQDHALDCRRFITDFINRGYGENCNDREGWLIALDLQDIIEILSDEMRYCKFECDSKDASDTFSNFLTEINVKDAKSLLICVYNASVEENAASAYDTIMETIYEASPENCVIVQQLVADETIGNKTVIHIICN